MEPSDEPILRVNCDQTALVLGGSASAPVPPCSIFAAYDVSVPLHGEIVEQLASIIAPALCPSNILPRIKFSTFLYGPSGYCNITAVSSFVIVYYSNLN
jgi:peroxin-6